MKPDSSFGNYRLIEVLGQGAMGSVWRALDLRLEREVALKVLMDVDEARHRALLSEAKLASQLNHPNIAHIYEAGEVDGTPFIAMELVEGRTLRKFVGQPATGPWLLSVALQAAGALQAAHDRGIIHRDIKPENLVLKADGTLKILDFGIARLQNRSASTGSTGHHATLIERTAPGYSQGTPAYMSPEQANGFELAGGSDQFSLGVVLYELATGVHPFLRPNLVETLFAVVKDEVKPLREARKDLPEGLSAAIDKMMGKMPLDRYASLEACQQDLRALEAAPNATTLRAPVLPHGRKTWAAVTALALVLVALGGVGGWWVMRRSLPTGGLTEARAAASQDFAKGRRVIAVLPLEQMVPDAELAWLSNSFADAMSTGLLQREDAMVVDRLRVQEVFAQLGEVPGKPLRTFGQVAKALKAESVVQGSYLVLQDRLRVSVRVLDAANGQVLHQFQLERPKAALLEMEDELQRRLPQELGLGGQGSGVRSRASNPRTRELFVKANQVLTEGNLESLHLARSYYEQAVAQEPDYAPAYGGLAWALQELGATTSLSSGKFEEGQKFLAEAKVAAERAIHLDPTVSQAYRALAAILMRQGDLPSASRAALQAVRMDPADTFAYTVLADVFAGLEGEDNYLAARRYFEKALALNPDGWQTHHRFAVLLQNNGLLPAALEHADQAIAKRPLAEYAHVTAIDTLLWMGRPQEAKARLDVSLRLLPASNILKSLKAIAAFDLGETAAFLAAAKELEGVWDPQHPNTVFLAGLSKAAKGDRAGCLAVFKAFLDRTRQVDWSTKKHSEKRVTSLNLYFMARTLARTGSRPEATAYVDLADRLHSGKRKVMAVDPAFRG